MAKISLPAGEHAVAFHAGGEFVTVKRPKIATSLQQIRDKAVAESVAQVMINCGYSIKVTAATFKVSRKVIDRIRAKPAYHAALRKLQDELTAEGADA